MVHFGGAGEAPTNLMGGHADTYSSTMQSVVPHVNDGRAKALAVLAPARFALLPDIQSSGEVGVSGVELEGWVAIFALGGMEEDLANRVNADLAVAMATDRMQEQLAQTYAIAGSLSSAKFTEIYVRDLQIWQDLATERGIGQ
ncbi:MAG: hypothetical protein IKG52_02495 [Rhodobacteraceae bacterium]|nr:hypothetical protein [Paracoccaceae bacterium]